MLVNVLQTVRSHNPEDSSLYLRDMHTRAPTHPVFRKIRRKSHLAQVGIGYVYGPTYVYLQWSPVEMQSPPLWNSINSRMAALQPVLSPNSILLPSSCHFAFILSLKTRWKFQKCYYFNIFYFFLNCISEIALVTECIAKSFFKHVWYTLWTDKN
jgi:hypothetical protein